MENDKMKKPVFVTGGTGFVGSELIRDLVARGHPVTALARSQSSDRLLRALGASPVRGSLDNVAEWADAVAGHSIVIHLASPITVWGDPKQLDRQIVQASLEILRACNRNGVERMIHMSSESVLQNSRPLANINEKYPYPTTPNSRYGSAKKNAEIALLAEARETTLIILRAPFIWGDGGQIHEILDRVREGQFAWINQGRAAMEMVHRDNLIHAIELAMEKGQDGKIYMITDDERLNVRDFFTPLFEAFGEPVPTKSMPLWLVRPLARWTETIWKLVRAKNAPPLSRFQLDFVALPRRYDTSRAQRDLGYFPQVSFQEGVTRIRKLHTRHP